MHIIFLTHEYPKKGLNGGGIGSFIQFLGRKLVIKNVIVSVVGVNNSFFDEVEDDCGVKIYRAAKSKWKVGKFYQNTKRILKVINELNNESKVDLVEGSELSFAFFPKKTTYKKVIRLHGGHHFFAIELGKKTALWRSFQERRSFSKADAFIAVSNYVGEKTQQYLRKNLNFKTIYNSIDVDKFKQSDTKKIKQHTLLFVGTVCEKKGIRQLVQALPKIKSSFPKVKLIVAGRDWYFPNGNSYTKYLKTFIVDDIKENIEILGAIPHNQIPKLIESAEICVFPSHMEAMPIAWLESLLMGKPTIVGDIGPAKEAIKENVTGLSVNPYEPDDIAAKIIYLLKNPVKALELGENARKDILERFHQDLIVEENIKFYKSLIK